MSNPMNLIIPTPGVTSGPQYATEVSDDLTVIASHTHTGSANGDGLQIPTAGLNINEDLSMQSNNLVSSRSNRYSSQSSTLAGVGDINATYVVNGNLYYNNAAGTPIQITSGSAILFTNNINYAVLAVSSNHTINFSDVVTVLECDSTSNTIIITLPSVSSVPAGRLYIVKDFKGTSETHIITVNPSGTDKIDQASTYVITDNHAAIAVVSDGVGNWSLYPYNRKVYVNGDVIKLTGGATLTSDVSSPVTLVGALNSTTANITQANMLDAEVTNFISGAAATTLKVRNNITAAAYLRTNQATGVNRVSRLGGAADPAAWVSNNTGIWQNTGLGLNCQFNLNLPNAVRITSVTISFQGAAAHAGLPANMPSIAFKNYNMSSALDLTIGSQADTSANTTAFQLQHAITISGLTHIVDNSANAYHIAVTAESGANALVGSLIFYYNIVYDVLAGSVVG